MSIARLCDWGEQTQPTNLQLQVRRVYNKLRIPYWLFIIEIWNLNTALRSEHWDNDKTYAKASLFSALVDVSTVGVQTYNHFAGKQGLQTIKWATNTTANLEKFSFKFLGYRLVRSIANVAVLSCIGGLLTAALSGWDAIRAFNHNDYDAAICAGLAAIAFATLAVESSILYYTGQGLIMVGPIGWIAIAVGLIASLGYLWFKDNEVEAWLANGPFGQPTNIFGNQANFKDEYSLLKDPETAYQYWTDLIMGLTITVYPLNKLTLISPDKKDMLQKKGVTHAVCLRTNIPMDFNEQEVQLQVQGGVLDMEAPTRSALVGKITKKKFWPFFPLQQTEVNNAWLAFYHFTPTLKSLTITGGNKVWQEGILKARGRIVFSPSLSYPLPSLQQAYQGETVPSQPDFNLESQTGWASGELRCLRTY